MSTGSWEERYSSAERLFGDQPSELLLAQRALLRPGMRALAIADGEGRNGVWLAEQGLIGILFFLAMATLQISGLLDAGYRVRVVSLTRRSG